MVFEDRPRCHWWDWFFTSRGFRHCWSFNAVHDAPGLFFADLPHTDRMRAGVMTGSAWDIVKPCLAAGHRLIVVEIPKRPYDPRQRVLVPKRGLIMTCAAVIAYRMGLPERIVTPAGLHRALLKRYGGRIVT